MGKNNYGICHICGKEKELTFEHLPPRKANNSNRAKAIVGDELTKHIAGNNKPWDFSDCKYKNMQRGMGRNSICKECNNNTGANYANEYIKFSNTIGYALSREKMPEETNLFRICIEDVYILRIIKQIYAMFASTLPETYISEHPDLQKFILDKDYNEVDWSNYRLSIFAIKEGINSWTGIVHYLIQGDNGIETKSVATMNLYPLGFVLEFDPKGECENTEITHLADGLKYDTKCNVELTLRYRNKNSFLPLDYRTKEQIESDMESNKEKTVKMYKDLLKERNIHSEEAGELIKKYEKNEITVGEFSVKIHEIIDKDKKE